MSRSGFLDDQRLVREVRAKPDAAIDRASWPADVPAVAAVLESGLELAEGVTFLVGENGSGKSSGRKPCTATTPSRATWRAGMTSTA